MKKPACEYCGSENIVQLSKGSLCKNPDCLRLNIPHEEVGKILQDTETVESSCLPKVKGGSDEN